MLSMVLFLRHFCIYFDRAGHSWTWLDTAGHDWTELDQLFFGCCSFWSSVCRCAGSQRGASGALPGELSEEILHYFDIVGHSWIWLEIFGHSCYGCFLAAAPPGVLFGVLLVLGEEHLVVSQCFLAECCTYTDIVGYSWRMPSSFSFLCSPWYSNW